MRIHRLKLITLFLFLFLMTGLIKIQVFENSYYKDLSQENRIRIIPIKAARGNIYDRNGKVLARSRLSFSVAVIPKEVSSNNELFARLSKILNVNPALLINKMKKDALSPFNPVVIQSDIPKDKAILIEEDKDKLPGVIIQTEPLREYIYSEATAHIIGYVGKPNINELQKLKTYGYKPTDLIGRAGIEKSFNSYLKGKDGGYQVEVDSRGRRIKVIGYKKPRKGKDIYLTIDIDIQNYIYELIKDKKAAVCLMSPDTGKIISLVSSPSFNPNIFINPDNKKNRLINQLFNSDSYPMVNRCIQTAYPVGSLFKIVTSIAALETDSISETQQFNCPGYFKLGGRVFHCWKESGHGLQTVRQALKNSCNVFFYNVGLKVGVDNLTKYAKKFGFGEKTGIQLPDEARGLVPSKHWKLKTKNEPWYDGETVIFAIGQGYFLATPLQALRMISAIANGGNLVYPQIVERIEDVDIGYPEPKSLNLEDKNIQIVKEGLDLVVSEYGTGQKAQVEGLEVAGKTATAQVSSGLTHAWFGCFFPVDKPEYAIIVFMEHGGSGGWNAAPLGKKIIEYIRDHYMENKS